MAGALQPLPNYSAIAVEWGRSDWEWGSDPELGGDADAGWGWAAGWLPSERFLLLTQNNAI
jgi:hypothetical protein